MTQLFTPPLPGRSAQAAPDQGFQPWTAPLPYGTGYAAPALPPVPAPRPAARRRWWIWLLVALSAVLAVTCTLLAVLGSSTVRGDGSSSSPDTPTDQTGSPAAVPSTDDQKAQPGDPETTQDQTVPQTNSAIDPATFVSVLPVDFASCRPQPVDATGNTASAVCDEAASQPGPVEAHFYLYPDVATLDSAALQDFGGTQLFPVARDCAIAQGHGLWSDQWGHGQIACFVNSDGVAVLA